MTPAAQDVAVLSLAAAADLASTHYRISRGGSEGMPWMREPAGALLIKSGSVAVTAAACEHLRRRGHRRWAKAVRWGVTALWLGVAAHNMRQGAMR